jgi:uncharacterized protein YbbK (DUF523 family)
LGKFFSFVPVCPEVECGMTSPREVMQLEGDPVAPRLMTLQTRVDNTEQMLRFCTKKVNELEAADLCGFIFKERSPSCGLALVPLHDANNINDGFAAGLFANEVVRFFPTMPLEEAERLNNPGILKNFIERVFLYRRRIDLQKYESSKLNINLKSP